MYSYLLKAEFDPVSVRLDDINETPIRITNRYAVDHNVYNCMQRLGKCDENSSTTRMQCITTSKHQPDLERQESSPS